MFKALGDAYYDERKERTWASIKQIGNGMHSMWFGKKQSILLTASGPMLQIDRDTKVMLNDLPLMEYVKKMTRSNQPKLEDFARVNRLLKKRCMATTHPFIAPPLASLAPPVPSGYHDHTTLTASDSSIKWKISLAHKAPVQAPGHPRRVRERGHVREGG